MAHGTGYYWIRDYKADLQKDEYAVMCFRLRYYYYEDMSDCYEPTYVNENEWRIDVVKWRDDFYRKGSKVADHLCESVEMHVTTKDEANKIWWNLKTRNIRFDDVKNEFEKMKKGA